MARRDETILAACPWWTFVVLAVAYFAGMRFVIPWIFARSHDFAFQVVSRVAPVFAWVGLLLLIPAALLAVRSIAERRLLEKQRELEDIRALSWQQFELLTAHAYRRQGYSVQKTGGSGPDGGVDLVLKKDGNTLLVQCKQWKARTLGVNVVLEMFGVMTAQHAHGAIILSSGLFTQDARIFAAGKPIDLVEGQQLVELIRTAQSSLSTLCPAQPAAPKITKATPAKISPSLAMLKAAPIPPRVEPR